LIKFLYLKNGKSKVESGLFNEFLSRKVFKHKNKLTYRKS